MTSEKTILYYVYDPMCAWCWGYKPVWKQIEIALQEEVEIVYLLGGLAPDSDVPMPVEQQSLIASYWKRIEAYLGTEFNYEFWSKNTPRRSTYPACRAVIAARKQDAEKAMYAGIQHAYYLEAKNPSDNDVLIGVAEKIGLDIKQFTDDLLAESTHSEFLKELQFARDIGGNSFPSLFVKTKQGISELPVNYEDPEVTVSQVRALI